MFVHQGLGDDIDGRLSAVRIERKHPYIVYRRPHAQCCIRRQSPWSSSPCDKAYRNIPVFIEKIRYPVPDDFKLHDRSGILHVTIASGLVQFMRTQACARSRRIRLYGVTFIQKFLAVYILQKIPQCLDVSVVIGDIRIIHIHPITDFLGHRDPLFRVLHHLLAAGTVVFFDAYPVPDILFRYAQHLLHPELYGEPVRIPTGTPVHLVSALRLVSAYGVLDRPGHDMMDTGHSVCGRRAFEKYKLRSAFPDFQ